MQHLRGAVDVIEKARIRKRADAAVAGFIDEPGPLRASAVRLSSSPRSVRPEAIVRPGTIDSARGAVKDVWRNLASDPLTVARIHQELTLLNSDFAPRDSRDPF